MAKEIHLKVRRQASPKDKSYWEEFKIPYEPQHNVISVLMKVRENPINTSGDRVEPVVWEANCMEEVCGACTIIVNGVPRQACATLIDGLPQPIVLEPLTKFPVVRDLSGDQASYVVSRRQSQINSNVPTAGPNDVRQMTKLLPSLPSFKKVIKNLINKSLVLFLLL